MLKNTLTPLLLALLVGATGCHRLSDYVDEVEPTKPNTKLYASGLAYPLGLEMGDNNRLWVTENGTGQNDGQVSMIMPSGKVYPAIVGFPTFINPEGLPGGLNHMAYRDGILYILNDLSGRLYMADVSRFKPGDSPVQASSLPSQEIRSFILEYDFGPEDTNETNIYNLAFGPEGDLYIVAAAANAIIRRDAQTGELSVFAHFADIPNPTPIGPPMIDVVPTAIVWDGDRFLVSSLIGFPFPVGASNIYALDTQGNISIYQEGFTSLVDIALGPNEQPFVLQYSEFGLPMGFKPDMGRIIMASGSGKTVLKDHLNYPTALVLDGRKAYVTSLEDGTVTRIIW
ncbi:ScyD/ScyE family protein [Cesiribacter andamanensis]|uniref:Streptogramin lyase n=1 Tax=Cesiribacter andamanensis AMV16 TaxID=1279009 RepID=M7N3Y1_9BACT|nr:ScyD/ScyE family protein [Cesiribacter andamanensis]EMR01921.1 Streptogramin lyase [Cesiribacter andamanensis AMV16]